MSTAQLPAPELTVYIMYWYKGVGNPVVAEWYPDRYRMNSVAVRLTRVVAPPPAGARCVPMRAYSNFYYGVMDVFVKDADLRDVRKLCLICTASRLCSSIISEHP